MSAALSLKQTIYQLPNESLLEVLSKYFLSKSHDFSSQTTQKAYKCFECCILVDQAKYCAGFGRTESEASLNAVRIALESIIDSGDSENLSKVLIQPQAKCELSNMLKSINCSEYLVSLQAEKIQYADIEKYSLEVLKKIFPLGPALKVFNFFHPNESTELGKLQEMNEKLLGLLCLKSPPKHLLCPISHELMEDPVFTSDGHTYEKKSIEAWLMNHCTSPITGLPLENRVVKPNFAVKMALQAYKDTLSEMGIKPLPVLISNPLRDLYKSAYGHQFAVPFADLTNEKLSLIRTKAEMALSGSINIKYC